MTAVDVLGSNARDLQSEEKLDPFRAKAVAAFREYGTITHACEAAGISRQTWYNWLERDPVFAREVMDADEVVIDELEKEAILRAKAGSDGLLIFLLKAKRPRQYGDKLQLNVIDHPDVQRFVRALAHATREVAGEDAWRQISERVKAFGL